MSMSLKESVRKMMKSKELLTERKHPRILMQLRMN